MDSIDSYIQNQDGSFDFSVTYYAGDGTMGKTVVSVQIPEGAESLSYEDAVILAEAQATLQRDHWIQAQGLPPAITPVKF